MTSDSEDTKKEKKETKEEEKIPGFDFRNMFAGQNAGANSSNTNVTGVGVISNSHFKDDTKKDDVKDTETVARKDIDDLKSELERHKDALAREGKKGDLRDATNKDRLGRLAKQSKDRHEEGMGYTGKVEKDARQGLRDLEDGFGNELGYLRADMDKGFDNVGKRVDGYITSIDDLSQKVEKCEGNVSEIGKEVAACLNRVLDLEGTTEQYKKEIKELQEKAEGAATQEQLQEAISSVKQKLGDVIKESEERSKEYTETVAYGIIQTLDGLRGELDGYNTRIEELKGNDANLKTKLEEYADGLESFLGRLSCVEGVSGQNAEDIEKLQSEVESLQYSVKNAASESELKKALGELKRVSDKLEYTRKQWGDALARDRKISQDNLETVAGAVNTGIEALREEVGSYKTKLGELDANVAGFDDKLLEIKGELKGMVDELSEKTGGQYEGLRKVVDGLSGENAERVIETVKNYMGAMAGDIESLKKSPTYIQDTVSEGVIDREMTKKYQGKHGLGENLTVGGLLDKAGEAGNKDEKERLEQIACAAGAKRCKQLGISYKVLDRSIKHAGDTKDPTYKKGVMSGVKRFLKLEKDADRYQRVLGDILEKGTLTKNEKEIVKKMGGSLSYVGMSLTPEYATNGKPTEGYIKELSSKLKKFKELMK